MLTDWSSKKFGDVRHRLKKARAEYERERACAMHRGTSQREKKLARQIAELLR
jgi:hypothetical protein